MDADSPARFNADPDRLFEASGSAGKAVVFAVRLDTFAAAGETGVFYIGASDPAVLTRIRRDILSDFEHLPVAGEYMHRDCYDIARKYGKDTFLAIRTLGTGRIGRLFGMKSRFDAFVEDLGVLPKIPRRPPAAVRQRSVPRTPAGADEPVSRPVRTPSDAEDVRRGLWRRRGPIWRAP